jgi:hypothetical protein
MAIISNKDAARNSSTHGAGSWQAERVTPFLRDSRTGGALALKRVAPLEEETAPEVSASLPLPATATDVREVVRLLKRRTGGLTIIEGMDAARRVFDPRKIAAYEYWGLVKRTGDRLSLSALGREFARTLEPEAQLYRTMLNTTLAYRTALEWMFDQKLEIVTDADIAACWLEHPAEVVLAGNQKTIEGNVACFFHLCQEAELGVATIGKRGQPTRLRVDCEELSAYIAQRSSLVLDDEPAKTAPGESTDEPRAMNESRATDEPCATDEGRTRDEGRARVEGRATSFASLQSTQATAALVSERMRVFISQSRDAGLVKQIQATLEVADIESETSRRANEADKGGQFVPDELCRSMRCCDAAIIIVNRDDCRGDDEGRTLLGESLLMEIAAAIVHYNRRVILLWDERAEPPPARLHELTLCKLAGEQLTWDSGMQLLKALKNFKSETSPQTSL